MKEQDVKLTIQETEQLCRLYMDCRLSVLEETELQYVLGKLPYSSPCIDEARMLMGLSISTIAAKPKRPFSSFFRSRSAIGIAASFAILLAIGVSLLHNRSSDVQNVSSLSSDNAQVYIAAYSHGKQLDRNDAVTSTNIAMAKADSLMKHASMAERDYMSKANDIISATSQN